MSRSLDRGGGGEDRHTGFFALFVRIAALGSL